MLGEACLERKNTECSFPIKPARSRPLCKGSDIWAALVAEVKSARDGLFYADSQYRGSIG